MSEESTKNYFFQDSWIPSNSPADTPNHKLAVSLRCLLCIHAFSNTTTYKYRHN
jgi:hypothetical protein